MIFLLVIVQNTEHHYSLTFVVASQTGTKPTRLKATTHQSDGQSGLPLQPHAAYGHEHEKSYDFCEGSPRTHDLHHH